ncbi:MAG: zf-TFIIB domain-containing protein [Chloroflexota bacterium]
MICPVCKQAMIVVEHKKIELDFCPKCTGVWFDSGELELFAQSVSLRDADLMTKDIITSPDTKAVHEERKCPVCNQRMKETTISEPAIHIDACRRGDGLWFDGGEVHQLLRQLPKKEGSQQKIITFLGEAFKAEQ